jgi:hypothetical protein
MEIDINFKEIDLVVRGNYSKDYDSFERESHSFEIFSISVSDSVINIYDLFSSADLELIEELIIEKIV